jgi:hypothetical protein
MKRLPWLALATVACALAACSAVGPGAGGAPGWPLANPGFEEGSAQPPCPAGWSCGMHADPTSFRFLLDESRPAQGRRSLCIEPVRHEPWAKASQWVLDPRVRGKRVRLSLAVRTERVAGDGAGALIVAHGDTGQILGTERQLVSGDNDWRRVATELVVPPTMHDIELSAVLEGSGRACFDDVRLEVM